MLSTFLLPESLATIVYMYWAESVTLGEGTRSENENKQRKAKILSLA